MDQDQSNVLTASIVTDVFITENKTVLYTAKNIEKDHKQLQVVIKNIQDAAQHQSSDSSQAAPTASSLKYAMAKNINVVCNKVYATVEDSGDKDLFALIKKPVTYITSAKKNTDIALANNIIEAIKTKRASLLTEVTDDDVKLMEDGVAAYAKAKDLPQIKKSKKKVEGTHIIEKNVAAARKLLKRLRITGEGNFLLTNSELYDGLYDATEIAEPGVTHTAAELLIVDEAGKPIGKDAAATEHGKAANVYEANDNSVISIATHYSGTFTFTIAAPGRKSVEVNITFEKGKKVSMRLVLVKE